MEQPHRGGHQDPEGRQHAVFGVFRGGRHYEGAKAQEYTGALCRLLQGEECDRGDSFPFDYEGAKAQEYTGALCRLFQGKEI